jgi:membrane-associated phospholipid phosphatase
LLEIISLSKANPHSYFRTAVAVTLGLFILVIIFLLIFGKRNSFLIINGSYNEPLDYFFQYVTLLGDGLIYIPIVIYSLFFNRSFLVPLIASIIICTFITHFLKRVVFPNELRPVSLEIERIIIHKIDGVPMHRLHSFPSGHTSTAFTMALLLSSVMKKKFWAFILPVVACLVGYSRVYLAQHFIADVCAGMAIGIVSAYLSLLIYDWYRERKALKTASLT